MARFLLRDGRRGPPLILGALRLTMLVLVMGRIPAMRTAVASRLSQVLGWESVQGADEFGDGAADRIEVLRARMSGAISAGRSVVYAGPLLSPRECRLLRESLREIELVRLTDGAWQQPPIAAALTLDGTMSPSVLASTICAVLRLVERTSTV